LPVFNKKKKAAETLEKSDDYAEAVNSAVSKDKLLGSQIEKLKAKVEALNELRKADSERFTRFNEEVGEIRNMIFEKEKSIEEINTKSTKAADMVAELQPEKIIKEMQKYSAKYETLDTKIDAINALYRQVLKEIKEIRSKLALFGGTEELISLNKQTAENLVRIKQSEAGVERYSNEVGNKFVQFQKQFEEFSRFRDLSEVSKEEFKRMAKEFSEIKIKADSTLIGKKDLLALKTELQKRIGEVDRKLVKSKGGVTSGRLNTLESQFELLKAEAAALTSSLKKTDELITGLKEVSPDGRIEKLEKEVIFLNNETSTISRSLQMLVQMVTRLKRVSDKDLEGPVTLEEGYNEMVKDIKDLVYQGLTYQAIVKYNILKETYEQLVKIKSFPSEKHALYARLKEAYNVVNSAMNK